MTAPSICSFDLGSHGRVTGGVYPAAGPCAGATYILAHGAGAPQTHPFIVSFATGLSSRGLDVVTFNFPYMEARRKLPDPGKVLEACYAAVVQHVRAMPAVGGNRLVTGGKSMGGRIASQVVARDRETADAVSALVFLGYPLHPPAKRKGDGSFFTSAKELPSPRSRHLPDVRKPMLFVQGSRDAFGAPAELEPIVATLRPTSRVLVVEGGDHSFSLPKSAGIPQPELFTRIQDAIATWIKGQP